jgi:hypothetical protein
LVRRRLLAKPSICNACELKARRTSSEYGDMLYRPFQEDFYDSYVVTAGLTLTRRP